MVRPVLGPQTPGWARRGSVEEDRAKNDRATAPSRLVRYADTASLPDPTAWTGSLAFHIALGVPVMSDGVHWYPITVGAHL